MRSKFLYPLRLPLLVGLMLLPLTGLRADDTTPEPTAEEIAAQPANLAGGLRHLAATWRKQTRVAGAATATGNSLLQRRAAFATVVRARVPRAQSDDAGQVVVNISLDGSLPTATVRASLEALGLTILGELPAPSGPGKPGAILSAWLPPEAATDAARTPGVYAVALAHRPWRRVGRVTTQGAGVLHTDTANGQGYTGRGITVGVISDSYNLTSPTAATDVLTGDLPGAGNPLGHTTAVKVLAEGDRRDSSNADEGRAMLQIVHDLAPDATLAFASVGQTQTTFATSLSLLRTTGGCQIVVDDIGFADEPFFSDSPLSLAVSDAVAAGTIYLTAAGNDGALGYQADFLPVPDALVRAGKGIGNLQLGQVPAALTAGGFHNFKGVYKGHGTGVAQTVTIRTDTPEVNFQWDDPFVPGKVSTDYNLLVFDVNGNFLASYSGLDSNPSTGQALEIIDLPLGPGNSDRVYQFAITRAATANPQAVHLRYLVSTAGSFESAYLQPNLPAIFGHSAARGADAVAAYAYNALNVPEDFTSFGPATIFFDRDGNRLGTPEARQIPAFAAPDGVNTSFFPQPARANDSDGDGFPNFFGTSAAAPHAAGVAALLLQAAGGPGRLAPDSVRSLLQQSAAAHDLDPSYSAAAAGLTGGQGTVSLVASGDASNNGAFETRFFTLAFDGPAGSSLTKFTLDLSPSGEVFDPTVDNGFPFTVGLALNGVNALGVSATISSTTGGGLNRLLLRFAPGVFPAGGTLSFGLDRDSAATRNAGNNADLLAGSVLSIKAVGADGTVGKGGATLANTIGQGYSPDVGYGLINAQAAINLLLGR